MKKYIFTFPLLILLFACSTQPAEKTGTASVNPESGQIGTAQGDGLIRRVEDLPPWIYDSSPKDGRPRYVVFTGSLGKREDEEKLAPLLAALEAAKHEGIYVSAKELSQEGNRTFGYAKDIFIDYREELAPAFLDKVELEKSIYTAYGTIARYIEKEGSADIEFAPHDGNPPSWIYSPPRIPGYLVAVGVVERHRSWKESFAAADEKALARMVMARFGELDNQAERKETEKTNSLGTRESTASLETIYVRGEGLLRDVTILARWTDSAESQFYSLAVLPVAHEQ